jgi:CheY-like chemotaxis protein
LFFTQKIIIMANSGPIILVDDDTDDLETFTDALRGIGKEHEVIWFKSTSECMNYLETTTESPFIIFCDINLPFQSGIEFKHEIDENPRLREKSIPFVFYSTSVDQELVLKAYTQMTVQGFFQKKSNFNEIKQTLEAIVRYWEYCCHPNADN